jgi:hypothetical protein
VILKETLRQLAVAALGQVPQSAGVPDGAIIEAERALGVSLPATLREFYRTLGSLPEVMSSHHQFLPIQSLAMRQDGLVFCREQQGQMAWAILATDLGAADPPVVQGQHGSNQWDEHCSALSVFLVNFSCWQLLNSMPSMGSAQLGSMTVTTLRKSLAVVGASFGFNMISFVGSETGVLASALLDTDRLYVGARSDAALQALDNKLDVDLDWL